MKKKYLYNYSFYTTKGIRPVNEDAGWIGTNKFNQTLAIICDGVGCQKGSDLASSITVDIFKNSFLKKKTKIFAINRWVNKNLLKTFLKLNSIAKNNLQNKQISTTMILCFMEKNIAHIFWIGDSRIYLFSSSINSWKQLTKDHNLYNYLTDKKASSLMFDKYKDKFYYLTKSISNKNFKVSDVEHKKIKINQSDIILLLSDGAYNYIDFDEVIKYIKNNRENHTSFAKQISKIALNNLSDDNISVIYIDFLNNNNGNN